MIEQELNHILYFQRWQAEFSKAAMIARERGFDIEAIRHQEQAATCYRTIVIWRGY